MAFKILDLGYPCCRLNRSNLNGQLWEPSFWKDVFSAVTFQKIIDLRCVYGRIIAFNKNWCGVLSVQCQIFQSKKSQNRNTGWKHRLFRQLSPLPKSMGARTGFLMHGRAPRISLMQGTSPNCGMAPKERGGRNNKEECKHPPKIQGKSHTWWHHVQCLDYQHSTFHSWCIIVLVFLLSSTPFS